MHAAISRRAWWGIGAVALAALVAWVSSIGGPHDALLGLAVVLERVARNGVPSLLYLASAAGFGLAIRPWVGPGTRAPAIALALGLAAMFSLTHLMGVAGLLSTPGGAWTPVVVGLGLLAWRWRWCGWRAGGFERPEPVSWVLLACGGVAWSVMLVAASSPPGWLWGSEFGGYDALSYHLQLPREWRDAGRVWPLEHNVYSFLPGYAEAAFLHVRGLGGSPAYAPQFLHAGLALLAAFLTGEASRSAGASRIGGLAAGVVLLGVPWTVVTGSMAYNEMGVLAMLAGAMVAAMDRGLPEARRGLIVGLLTGVACGFKPSAIVLATPAAAVTLLGFSPLRSWARLVAWACAGGLVALSPWLIRNFAASGNPVFPYLASLFGHGHWSAEQVERFARGHRFEGGLADRLALIVMPDRADPARPGEPVHRGALHPQWSIFFPAALVAIGLLAAGRSTRRAGVVLGAAMVGQVVGWLLGTHVQSRFLLPAAVTGAAASGLACRGRAAWALAGLAATLAGSALWRFAHERQGHPNAALVVGVGLFDGSAVREEWQAASPDRRAELAAAISPEALLNLMPDEGAVYLLGDATPFHLHRRVVYHTTWDASPLGALLRSHPDDPARWTGQLRARGVEFVLWNAGEVARLQRSGWSDPRVTNEVIERWLREHARLVQAWPDSGRYLFRLLDPADSSDRGRREGPDGARTSP